MRRPSRHRRRRRTESPLSPEEARQQELIGWAQSTLHVSSVILGVIDSRFAELTSCFVDSPLREAMEEGEIPSDVPTALQEAVETFRETLRSLRTSIDEAVLYTPTSLVQHWRCHQLPQGELAGERASATALALPADALPR